MRYLYKSYFKIPFGEIQYTHRAHTLAIWIGVKCLYLWRGKQKRQKIDF